MYSMYSVLRISCRNPLAQWTKGCTMYPAEVDCGDDGGASCERGWDAVKGDKNEGLHLKVISGKKQ